MVIWKLAGGTEKSSYKLLILQLLLPSDLCSPHGFLPTSQFMVVPPGPVTFPPLALCHVSLAPGSSFCIPLGIPPFLSALAFCTPTEELTLSLFFTLLAVSGSRMQSFLELCQFLLGAYRNTPTRLSALQYSLFLHGLRCDYNNSWPQYRSMAKNWHTSLPNFQRLY